MCKLKLLLFFLFLGNVGFSQGSIDFDNIWKRGIMYPDIEYKNARVKTVRYVETNLENMSKKTSASVFDKNGYLFWENNWDSSFIVGGELISVNFLDNSVRKVTRKIASSDYLKIVKPLSPSSFWVPYAFSGIDKNKSQQSDSLEFVSYLQWRQDSSVAYKQYFNNQLLDSGSSESIRLMPVGEGIWDYTTTVQVHNGTSRDSIIRGGPKDEPESKSFLLTTFSILDGKIQKATTMASYEEGKIKVSTTDFYKYDSNGKLSLIESMNDKATLISRTVYDYSETGKRITIKEKYLNGVIDSKTVMDDKGKILMELTPAKINTRLDTKFVYTYYDNGLIKNIEQWYGDTRFVEKKYVYTYFDYGNVSK